MNNASPSSKASDRSTVRLRAVEQRRQPLATRFERGGDKRLPVGFEKIENVVDELGPSPAAWPRSSAGLSSSSATTSPSTTASWAERRGALLRQPLRSAPVRSLSVRERSSHTAAAQVGERPVSVELHLVEPLLPFGSSSASVASIGSCGCGRCLCRVVGVAASDQEPVLLLAVEVSRDERPHPLEPLPVKPHLEARRLACPRGARRCPGPRSRPCRRRRSPSGSRPRSIRSRAGGPRRGPRAPSGPPPAERPSAPPRRRAHRRARAGSRSGGSAPRAAGRRRPASRPEETPPNGSGVGRIAFCPVRIELRHRSVVSRSHPVNTRLKTLWTLWRSTLRARPSGEDAHRAELRAACAAKLGRRDRPSSSCERAGEGLREAGRGRIGVVLRAAAGSETIPSITPSSSSGTHRA